MDLRNADAVGNDLSGIKTRASASKRALNLGSEESRVFQEVHDMFTGTVDDAVIQAVLQQTRSDAERAVEFLFDLSSRRPPPSNTAPAAAINPEPACTAADDKTGEAVTYFSITHHYLIPDPDSCASDPVVKAGECWWAILPTDVQLQVGHCHYLRCLFLMPDAHCCNASV